MSLYQALDLAINSLSFGSILFFGSLFILQSFSRITTKPVAVPPPPSAPAPAAEEQERQVLFSQANHFTAHSVNPPISVEKADNHLNQQIASIVAEQHALSSAIATIAPPLRKTAAAKNLNSTRQLTVKTENQNDLNSLPSTELIALAKAHKFPGSNKWSKNRPLGQKTKDNLISFLKEKL